MSYHWKLPTLLPLLVFLAYLSGCAGHAMQTGPHYVHYKVEFRPAATVLVMALPVPTDASIANPLDGSLKFQITRDHEGQVIASEITSSSGNSVIDTEIKGAIDKTKFRPEKEVAEFEHEATVNFRIESGEYRWGSQAKYSACLGLCSF